VTVAMSSACCIWSKIAPWRILLRHKLNRQERTEPRSADEVLAVAGKIPRAGVEPWDGVRDALAFGPKSPQVAYPPEIAVRQSKSCRPMRASLGGSRAVRF